MTTERDVLPGIDLDRRAPKNRRAPRTKVRFPERRMGFDRRTDPSTGRARVAYLGWIRRLSESPERVALLMISLVVLNIADMAFTFRALGRGFRELNPVMAGLLDVGHGFAAFVKIGVSVVLAAAGWRFRRFRRVIEVALVGVAVMSLVVLYHLFAYFVV